MAISFRDVSGAVFSGELVFFGKSLLKRLVPQTAVAPERPRFPVRNDAYPLATVQIRRWHKMLNHSLKAQKTVVKPRRRTIALPDDPNVHLVLS